MMRRILVVAALIVGIAGIGVVFDATAVSPAVGQPGCRVSADVSAPTVKDQVTVTLSSSDTEPLTRWMVVRPGGSPEEIRRGRGGASYTIEPDSAAGTYRFYLFFYKPIEIFIGPPIVVAPPLVVIPPVSPPLSIDPPPVSIDPPPILVDPPFVVVPPVAPPSVPDPPPILIDPPLVVIPPVPATPDPPLLIVPNPVPSLPGLLPGSPIPELEPISPFEIGPRILGQAQVLQEFDFDILCGSVVIGKAPNPTVSLKPSTLTHGDTLSISGQNWPPRTRLSAEFSVAGARACGVDNRGSLGPFVTDSSGSFSSSYAITPDWSFGTWSVVVCGPKFSASANFRTVEPKLAVEIIGGPVRRGVATPFSADVNRVDDVFYAWDLFFAGDDIRVVPRSTRPGFTVPALLAGSYVLVVSVVDRTEQQARDQIRFTIRNAPPEVSIACPASALRNRDLVIGSTAKDDTGIKSYNWSLQGPENLKVADGGRSWTVNLSRPGKYLATVTVEDDEGATSSSECGFTLPANAPPRPLLVCVSPVLVGERAKVDGSSSIDPDGSIVSHSWSFDDGSAPQTGPTAVVSSDKPATVTAKLVVVDNDKLSRSNSCAVQFVDLPPTPVVRPEFVSGGPYEATVGRTLTLSAAASKPNDATDIRYTWVVSGQSPLQGETARTTFASAGRFPVALTMNYVLNGQKLREVVNTTIAVSGAPDNLSVDAGGPYVVAVGEPVSLAAVASANIAAYRWTIGPDERGTDATIDLSFTQPGEIVVDLAVTDTAGRNAATQAIIRVTQPECAISPLRVAGFILDPSTGPAGVTVGGTLQTDLPASCSGVVLQRTLDGFFFGESVSIGSDGQLIATWFIPSNATTGDHVLGFNRANSSDSIAENLYVVGETCDMDTALRGLTLAPSSEEANDDVRVNVSAQLAPECSGIAVAFAVSGPGSDLGPSDPQPVDPDGNVSTSLELPPDVGIGTHTVTALRGSSQDLILGTATFDLAEAGGGLPLGTAGLVGLPLLLGAGGVAVVADRRRREHGDCVMRKEVVGACDGLRQVYEDKRLESDQIAGEVVAAEAEADELERQIRLGPDKTAFDTIDLRGEGLEEQMIDLRERSNPAAPRHGEEQGWFSPGRPETVKRITVRGFIGQDGPSSPADFIDLAATSSQPLSSHVVASRGGLVRLLPDNYAAMPNGELDSESLSVAVVAGVVEPKPAIQKAVQWTAKQAAAQKIPLEQINVTGSFGSVSTAEFLGQVKSALKAGESFMVSDVSNPLEDLRHRAAAAREKAAALKARQPEAQQEVLQSKDEMWECNCKKTPDAPEPPQDVAGNGSLWYLIRHNNPAGAKGTDGRRGWYREQRRGTIRGIVVHTAESSSASGVAAYFASVRRPASAHVVTDPDGPVYLLPDGYEALHSKDGNRDGLGIEIAYFADAWGADPDLERVHLDVAATWCARKCLRYGIPVVRLTGPDWKTGGSGFVAHGDLDPARRRDPGANFDWDGFFERIRQRMGVG